MNSWLASRLGWLAGLKDKRTSIFDNLIETAQRICDEDPRGLPALVKAILRPLQSLHIVDVAQKPKHHARDDIAYHRFFVTDGGLFPDPPRLSPAGYRIHLGRDLVLTTPWHRGRYVDALAHIGTGRKMGSWTEDVQNHSLTLCLPWGISFVGGGNHSIAAGILLGEGVVTPRSVLDYRGMFEHVHCDSRRFYNSKTGRVIAKTQDPCRAAVFEIGRLMHANEVSGLFEPTAGGAACSEP